jgi:two-component system, OmpR family, sensor histidine kinase KdpD
MEKIPEAHQSVQSIPPASREDRPESSGLLRELGLAAGVVAICTALCFAVFSLLALTDVVMVYLVGTLVVAMRGRRGPAVFASILSVLCFDFFFVPPRFTFEVAHPQYLVTFLVMFAVALVISHLTLRVRTQAEAAKRAEVAAELERLRSSLLSAVSHDLKTPLAAIIGSASSLLQGSGAGGKGRDLLETIRDEAERLARLVHNLLETTRLEAGGVQLKKELYPIEEVIGAALERLTKLLPGREIKTSVPESLPLVPMDAVLMELVFVNLIENAVRHTPAGTPIHISAREEENFLTILVADRGPGLAKEDLERVFEKFYRAKKTVAGAGLGLAICKAVVEAHGGSINAENRRGGGAVFRLTLPRKDSR